MSEYYQEMLWELANHSFDCGAFHGTDGARQARYLYDKVEAALIERDKKLVEALQAVVNADYSQAYEPRRIAREVLESLGEID